MEKKYIVQPKRDLTTLSELFSAETATSQTVRIDVFSEPEFKSLLQQISETNHVTFHANISTALVRRYIWVQSYVCDTVGCEAGFKVQIKRNTVALKYQDPLAATFPCMVLFSGTHTHSHDAQKKLAPSNITFLRQSEVQSWAPIFQSMTMQNDFRLDVGTGPEFKDILTSINSWGKVRFIMGSGQKNRHKRYVYTKTYICHYGGRSEYKACGCEVRMKVCIKKVTTRKIEKDKYLAEFPCFLSVEGTHTHEVDCVAEIKAVQPITPKRGKNRKTARILKIDNHEELTQLAAVKIEADSGWVKMEDSREETVWACDECNEPFLNYASLMTHVGSSLCRISQNYASPSPSSESTSVDQEIPGPATWYGSEPERPNADLHKTAPDPPYRCPCCGRTFEGKRSYLKHVDTHLPLRQL